MKHQDTQIAELKNRLVRQQQQPPQLAPEHAYEIDRLRRAVDSLLTSNVDKERRIDDLQASLTRFRRMFETAIDDAASDTVSHRSFNIAPYVGSQSAVQQRPPGNAVYSRPGMAGSYNAINENGDGYSATFPYPRTSTRTEQYNNNRPPSQTVSLMVLVSKF